MGQANTNQKTKKLPPNNYSNNIQPPLNQEQIQQKQDLQLLKIQYYVYEDLVNFFEILVDVSETLEHFKNVEDKTYIPIALNRLIVQNNLSKGIHFDCYYQFSKEKQKYNAEKEKALKLFETFLPKILYKESKEYKEYEQCIQSYKENLTNKDAPNFNLVPLLASNYKAQFNQSVVQKIFGGIQQVEQKLYEIKQGNYKSLTDNKVIQERIDLRKEWAKNLLKKNFPVAEKNDKTPEENQGPIKVQTPKILAHT